MISYYLSEDITLTYYKDNITICIEEKTDKNYKSYRAEKVVLLLGLHVTTCIGEMHFQEAADEAINWFKRYL